MELLKSNLCKRIALFRSYVEAHRDATVFQGLTFGQTKETLVHSIFKVQPDKWVDVENGKVNFEEESFIELLKFAAGYEAVHSDGIYGDGEDNYGEWIREGLLLF